jgi:hypothetical protein
VSFFSNGRIAFFRPVRLAYQPPASSIFLSEQNSQQYFSLRTNQHQPSATNQTNGLFMGRREYIDVLVFFSFFSDHVNFT